MFFFWIATTNFYDEPSIKVSIILSRTTSIGISLLIMIPKLPKPPLVGIPLGVPLPSPARYNTAISSLKRRHESIDSHWTRFYIQKKGRDGTWPSETNLSFAFWGLHEQQRFQLGMIFWVTSRYAKHHERLDTRNNLSDFIIYCAAYQVQHPQRLFTDSERQSFHQKNHSSQ